MAKQLKGKQKRVRKPRKQARKKTYKLEPYERYRTISGAPTAADILALQQAQMAQMAAANTQANLNAERVRQEYETERRRQQQQEQQAQQVGILEALNQRFGQQEAEQDNIMQRLQRGERYLAPRFQLLEQYGPRIAALEEQQRRRQQQQQYYDLDDYDEAASTTAARGQIEDNDDDTTIGGMIQFDEDEEIAQSAPSSAAAAQAATAPLPAAKPIRGIQPGADLSNITNQKLRDILKNKRHASKTGTAEKRARAAQVVKEIEAEQARRLNVHVEDEPIDEDADDNFDA